MWEMKQYPLSQWVVFIHNPLTCLIPLTIICFAI